MTKKEFKPYRIEVKKIENTNQFRPAAVHFIQYGYYTAAPKGTTAYFEYWDRETERCLHGFTSEEGNFISGYNYFYLNYCQIIRIVDNPQTGRREKKKGFPRYWDYDRQFFLAVEEAKKRGNHLAVLKARRKGYSYKIASMLARNFYFKKDSRGIAYAAENEFLVKDGILTKTWEYFDFIDENTAWYKKRQKTDTKTHKRASFVYDKEGVKTEGGYKSEVMGTTLKNDVDKVRGKGAELIIFEEAGKLPDLLSAWQIARPSVEQGSDVFGQMIVFGTGGSDDSDFGGLRTIFYEPDAYNCLPIENIWDEGNAQPCGFFVPDYYNFGEDFMDEDGNSDIKKAFKFGVEQREKIIKASSDRSSVDRFIAEHCVDKDTWISRENGVERIKNIEGHFTTGVKPLYTLKTTDGTEVLITENHPVYNGTDYVNIGDLKSGDTIVHIPTNFNKEYQEVPIKSGLTFLDYNLKIDEKWGEFLGYFMGDGYFYSKNNVLGIVFDYKDKDSADKMAAFLESHFSDIQYSIKGRNSYIDVRVCNKNLQMFMNSLGLIKRSNEGSKFHWKRNVHVPDYIIKSPKSVVAAFLRGYFDADGHATASGSSIGSFCKYLQVCKDVQFLLRGFGIHAKLSSREAINGNGRAYTENKVTIRSGDIEKFRTEINFRSERKRKRIENYICKRPRTYETTQVKSIIYSHDDLVYNIETPSHYYSANGLWVHNCFTPEEACLEISTNIFPKTELTKHLAYVRNNQKILDFKQVGDLVFDNEGLLRWEQAKRPKDLTRYKLEAGQDPSGQIVIWEHPTDNPPYGLYIGGLDPYDHDKSGTNSLGSFFIYKRFQGFESTYDTIVAEYTGRPDKAEDYYENVRKLLMYFNAKCLYENEKKGIFQYFVTKHSEHLLADQPDIIKDIIQDSKVNRNKGIHMVQGIKDWGEGRIRDWLVTDRGNGILNLHTLMSEPLLEELIRYNDKGNFDRVMAFMCTIIYNEEMHNIHIKSNKTDKIKFKLFDDIIFSNELFNIA